MPRLLRPAHRPLTDEGGGRRILRRPDGRHLHKPRLSGEPLTNDEVDYDDLVVHRTWREHESGGSGNVRYFMYEFSQRNPEERDYQRVFKAVRICRLTRVPRYLRQGSGGSDVNLVFEQQRDLLVALREKQTLFLNVIARGPDLPLVFGYGVQAVGATPEEAQEAADRSYAVLVGQLEGTYQQLHYAPLTSLEAEALVRYQSTWDKIAAARGRPLPTGGKLYQSLLNSGGRGEVESANNQLEAFLRGMGERSFMLSLITTPLAPAVMSTAWRNIAQLLSKVRSDMKGSRAVNAGVGIPFTLGMMHGSQFGDTHSSGEMASAGESVGQSASEQMGVTASEQVGVNEAVSAGVSATETAGASVSETQSATVSETEGISRGVSASETVGESRGLAVTDTVGVSEGASATRGIGEQLTHSATESLGASQGVSETATAGVTHGESATLSESIAHSQTAGESATVTDGASVSASEGVSVGQSQTVSEGASVSEGRSVGESASLTEGHSIGQSWSSGLTEQIGATMSQQASLSEAISETLQQQISLGSTESAALTEGDTASIGSDVRGGLLGFGGGWSAQEGASLSEQISESLSQTLSQTEGASATTTLGESLSESLSQSASASESVGGSETASSSATTGVSESQSVTAGQSVSSSVGESATQSASVGETVSQSISRGASVSEGLTLGRGVTVGETLASSEALAVGQQQSLSHGLGRGVTSGLTASETLGVSAQQSASHAQTGQVSQSASATQGVSETRSAAVSAAQTRGVTEGMSHAVSRGESLSETHGASRSAGQSVSESATRGVSEGASSQRSLSDAYMVAMSRTAQSTGTMGAIPQVGVMVSRETFNESKRVVGEILNAQMERYIEGVEAGAFLYQMYLTCPDEETLAAGSGLLMSAFWGSGTDTTRVAQPFHLIDRGEIEDPDERRRILDHARAFTTYRKREPVAELIEPFKYSSYITPSEMAAFCHPPTAEGLGLLAVHDSMPVMAMPYDRQGRDLFLGHVVNGERAKVMNDQRFGVDIDELTHVLIAGTTSSGKTTTLMRMLTEAAQVERTLTRRPTPDDPVVRTSKRRVGILALDWMQQLRDLAGVVEPERFRFYSVTRPDLGAFRWNPLAIPVEGMAPSEWLQAVADNFVASMGLGEFGRALFSELLTDLYSANRLEPYTLRPAEVDPSTGAVLRPAAVLDPVPEDQLPAAAIRTSGDGTRYANVFTHPALSRTVSMQDLATMVVARMEQMASADAGRTMGTQIRERLQSLWRRLQEYAPGEPLADLITGDPDLRTRRALTVADLVDPEQGLVTVVETNGLDHQHRRFVLGSVLLAVYRSGLHLGEGAYNDGGDGPGTFIVLEEAHELFGERAEGEDGHSAETRVALYESMFRRARALGLRLVVVAQNPGAIPPAVTSNTTTVLAHRAYHDDDRRRLFSLLNWNNQVGQQQREWRYLGEMARGYCIARLDARESFLESAPIHFRTDPPDLARVSDDHLAALARRRDGAAVTA